MGQLGAGLLPLYISIPLIFFIVPFRLNHFCLGSEYLERSKETNKEDKKIINDESDTIGLCDTLANAEIR